MNVTTISRRGRLAALVTALVLSAAFASVAAGSASAASWHVAGVTIPTNEVDEVTSPSDGTTEIVVPGRNARIVCASHLDVGFIAENSNYFFYQESPKSCAVYNLKKGTILSTCTVASLKPIVYNGKASTETVSSGAESFMMTLLGESCPLPEENPVFIPTLNVSFGLKEAGTLPVVATGSGTWGGFAATLTTSRSLRLAPSAGFFSFGWY